MKDILIPLTFGMILLLLGLYAMRRGLEQLANHRLKDILLRFTHTPTRSFITGIITTAILQSSSAVTVLTIGFVNAGILTFAQTIGIILGTNIGTTVTTQLMALKIEDFAVPMILFGSVLWCFSHWILSRIGLTISGFGLIFYGIDWMKRVAQPLKESGWITWLLEYGKSPILIGLIIGIVLTALIHSSSACIAMIMGFASSGVVTLPFAVAVVFGSNIGTCITAVLAAWGANLAAKQVALAHLILNVAGVALFTPWIPLIVNVMPYLSSDPASQIAHVQTLFNVICSLLVLPFCEPFARGIAMLTPRAEKFS